MPMVLLAHKKLNPGDIVHKDSVNEMDMEAHDGTVDDCDFFLL